MVRWACIALRFAVDNLTSDTACAIRSTAIEKITLRAPSEAWTSGLADVAGVNRMIARSVE